MTYSTVSSPKPLVLILDDDFASRRELMKKLDRLEHYDAQVAYDPMDIPASVEQTRSATILISRSYAMKARRELLSLFIRLSEMDQRVRIHYYRETYPELQAKLQAHNTVMRPRRSMQQSHFSQAM